MLSLLSCSDSGDSVDKEKPQINVDFEGAFPRNCDTLYFGEEYELNCILSDNEELGAFRIDLHNNFDQHSHSTEIIECDLEPKKTALTPFMFLHDYAIPSGLKQYKPKTEIFLAPENADGIPYETGNYHLQISVTDKNGWSSFKGFSVKIYRK